MYICILNYIDSKHQPWRVSVTDMGWLIHRSIFQGWKVWVQPIGTMNPSVVLIGTSRKLLLGFNRDYQNHEDIGPHVCWDSPTLRIEFQLWTLDFKKMICHDVSHDFPHQIPTTSSQELLVHPVHPGVPQPAGETGGTRGNLVGKRTSCPWINSLKTQLPRLHGSLWIASTSDTRMLDSSDFPGWWI